MDPATFEFYLHTSPNKYAPRGSELPGFERVLDDLQRLHGQRSAHVMGLAFLAQELCAYLLDTRVLPMAESAWRIDPESSPLFPRITDAKGQEIITVSSSRSPAEVTAIARLIAAAPDLLHAAQAALDEHEQPGAHRWAPDEVAYCDTCDNLRSAITKAITGQEALPECYDATAAAAEARLHRAAPDLLTACRAARDLIGAVAWPDGASAVAALHLVERITAAIAQATGEEVQNV